MVVVQLVERLIWDEEGFRRFESGLPYEIMGVYPVISSGPLCKSGG